MNGSVGTETIDLALEIFYDNSEISLPDALDVATMNTLPLAVYGATWDGMAAAGEGASWDE